MHKSIYDANGTTITYKNLGFTAISPDYESTSHVVEVANNFNIPVNIIDPANPNSIGLNPFIHAHAPRTAILISSILKGMYATTHPHEEETFMENVTTQAVENLVLLLKVMYPILHDGLLPNLEDLLKMLNDFDLVEEMCEQLKAIPELAEEYSLQIGYFEKNFYRSSEGIKDTERFVYSAITELDNLLRYPGVKNIKTASVEDFLWLIKNAEYVISGSYHGVVFSIIFNRNFYYINRKYTSRIKSLMNVFGLQDRILSEENIEALYNINYEPVNSKLNDFAGQSKKVLEHFIYD